MEDKEIIKVHPVQVNRIPKHSCVPQVVSMAAYEVYSHVYAPQEALITGNCRGGFSAGELIAFLYARSFPKKEWNYRVNEAINGMSNL